MPFKEGVEDIHVHAFRSVRTKATALDEAIDAGLITPHEAMKELVKFVGAIDIPAPKDKKKEAA